RTSLQLEQALQKNEISLTLALKRNQYIMDLVKMVQVNKKTKFERRIQRVESGMVNIRLFANDLSRLIYFTLIILQARVYCEGDDIYDVMLNQTNVQYNNNKYYLIQLLQDDSELVFSVWMRWGRVGKIGQSSLVTCGVDLLKAKNIFKKKFLDKTKNEWDNREHFEKVPGKYDIVKMDYMLEEVEKTEEESTTQEPKKYKDSKLKAQVQDLINLICNIQTMEECILEMKFDTQKAPLGKLTEEQIKAGYMSLKKIENCIKKNATGKELLEACNEFYTRIPHDFGDVYCQPMLATHSDYTLTLLDVFKMEKTGILLWHGSRLSNWAPVTGYMFGKGIYFADMSSKSANYCFANRQKNVGLLLLSEVALGECNELLAADYDAASLPSGKHSTKGLGKRAPDPKNMVTLDEASLLMGPAINTGVGNPVGYSLLYNEYIVYNPQQVRMKYLLKVQFNFVSLW
uniref:Poly [ADP-ribose] polymerase n=1 Tax=Erpetoichthys calabaricus TaxID=27687 RepID=A0A8C4RRE2_ERPCA